MVFDLSGVVTNNIETISDLSTVVYDLSGALEEGTEVVAIVTDLGEISTFSFDTATAYLNINTDATFYYALCKTASGCDAGARRSGYQYSHSIWRSGDIYEGNIGTGAVVSRDVCIAFRDE